MKAYNSAIILTFATIKCVMAARYVLLMAFLARTCFVPFSMAQSALTTANLLRSGDEFRMSCLPYMEAGQSGSGRIWDFSAGEPLDYHHEISYSGDSIIIGLENGTLNKYILLNDTLGIVGYENPLCVMDYGQFQPLLRFPMTLNDTLSCHFTGNGRYSDKYKTKTCGDYFVEADADGTLILTENDTLYHVLRLHSIRTASLTMECDTVTAMNETRQEIEERYTWYAPGYRYPVFVSLNRVNYYNLQPVSDFQASYRFLPEQQRMLPDSVNEEIAQKYHAIRHDELLNEKELQPLSQLISHQVTVSGHTVDIHYELNGSAHVTMLMADIMGMLHYRQEEYCESAGDYYATIDCTGLRHGEYILYINVNGQVKSCIIKI